MRALSILLFAMFIAIVAYTVAVTAEYGPDLVTPFSRELLGLTWSGQFNLDFLSYLVLSGLWIAWRDRFSGAAIGLGAAASVLGIMFFAPYLMLLLHRERYDLTAVLLGSRRAG